MCCCSVEKSFQLHFEIVNESKRDKQPKKNIQKRKTKYTSENGNIDELVHCNNLDKFAR